MTTLKTVSMYLRAAKTDAEEAGEATDGMASSVSELRSQILALTGNKVDIQIDENTFKSTYQILKELSTVWDQISDVSKANILEMVGGKRNANVVAALLENFEVAEKSLAVSADSAGSALAENEKQLNSIDGKIAKLSATFETLSQNFLESEYLKIGIDFLNFLLKAVDLLARANVLLPSIAASVFLIKGYISARPVVNSVIGLLPQLIGATVATDSLKESVRNLNVKEKELLTTIILSKAKTGELTHERATQILTNYGLAESIEGVGVASKVSATGIQTMWSAMSAFNKVSIIVSGILAVVGAIYSIVKAARRAKEEAIESAIESAKALEDSFNTIEEYKKKAAELRDVLDSDSSSHEDAYNARKELISIQEELIDKFGLEAKGINLVTGVIEDQIDAIDRLSKAEYDRWANKSQAAIFAMKDAYGKNYNDLIKSGTNLTNIIPRELRLEMIEHGISVSKNGIVVDNTNLEDTIEALGFYINSARDLPEFVSNTKFADHVKSVSSLLAKYEDLYNQHYDVYQTAVPNALKYEEYYAEHWNNFINAKTKFEEAVMSGDGNAAALALDNLQKQYDNIDLLIRSGMWRRDEVIQKYVEDYVASTQNELASYVWETILATDGSVRNKIDTLIGKIGYGNTTRQIISDLSTGSLTVSDVSKNIYDAYLSLQAMAKEANTDILSIYDAFAKLSSFTLLNTKGLSIVSEEDKKHIDAISNLLDLYQSAADKEGLNGLDITETLADYPDLASSIIEVAGGYNFTKESIEELIKAEAAQLEMSAKLRRDNARSNLIKTWGLGLGEETASWIDKVFEEYGTQISSLDDFRELTGVSTADMPEIESEYIISIIADENVQKLLDLYKDPSKYLSGSTKKEKSAFEKAYDDHQHLLAMEQETQEDYLKWLEGAYQNAYATGQIELEDYYKYQEEVYDGIKELFDDHLNDAEHRISLLELDGDKTDEIISTYSSLLDDIESQIAKYRANGLDENSEYIQELTDKLNEYKESILEAIDSVVEKANESVDGIKGAYDTLTSAAKEYAENGYLSVDSLQEILELSPKYLAMLYDENGQLVINEKSIQAVMAARAEELGAETALAYAKKILIATENDELEKLSQLTQITVAASGATWDMAYATIALAKAEGDAKGYDPKYYEDAYKAIANMQKITKTSVDSISAYYKTLDSSYISQKDALEKIIDLTKELIEWEHEKKIEALEEEKEGYSDIIEQKKEMLELAKEQEDREKSVAEKIAEMAKLQAQITQLSLDDSREAQAQRRKLEEELSKLQKEVTDEQSDYAYDKQVEALDKELEEFEKSKDEEIKAAEDAYEEMYGSAEKLHQAAIDRMSSDWGSLYDQLLSWNYNYGSTLQEELVSAWDAASEAVKRYGSVVDAISGTDDYTVVGPGGAAAGANVLESMKKNALDWWTATASDQKTISKNQEALGYQYSALTGENIYRKNGSWFHEDGTSLFNLSKDEIAHAIVNKMKQNSAMWMVSDNSLQSSLSAQNIELADRLKTVLGADIHRDSNGVWWIGNKKLYDAYHSGGIVGNKPSLKQKEVMAVLEDGEAVLDAEKEKNLFKVVDFISALSERLGTVLDADNINRIFGGVSTFSARTSIDNQIGRSAAKIAAGIGGNVTVERIEVTAPIQVTEKLDDEEIRRHSRTIGAIASAQIKESFTKQGISKGASIF